MVRRRSRVLIMCLSLSGFLLFLQITGLEVSGKYPVYTIHSDHPAMYVWTGDHFCTGGESA